MNSGTTNIIGEEVEGHLAKRDLTKLKLVFGVEVANQLLNDYMVFGFEVSIGHVCGNVYMKSFKAIFVNYL